LQFVARRRQSLSGAHWVTSSPETTIECRSFSRDSRGGTVLCILGFRNAAEPQVPSNSAVLISPFSRSAERQQQSDMMIGMRLLTAAAAATTLIFTALAPSWADEEFWAAVMRELPEASVSLDQALKTSEQEGKPISAEYDVEDGDFQISVYVEKDGHFREVIIDPQSGTINTTKPLTVAREVDEAQAQSAALRRAKLPLTAALATAEDLNSRYRAVSIIPLLGDGEVVVAITLMKGEAIKQVAQKLN